MTRVVKFFFSPPTVCVSVTKTLIWIDATCPYCRVNACIYHKPPITHLSAHTHTEGGVFFMPCPAPPPDC